MKPYQEHRLKVCALRQAYPHLTLQQLADKMGLAVDTVRHILIKAGLPTKAVKPPKIKKKLFIPGKKVSVRKTCITCGRWVWRSYWPVHKGKCHLQAYFIELKCEGCGTTFHRQKSYVRQQEKRGHKARFCSNICKNLTKTP